MHRPLGPAVMSILLLGACTGDKPSASDPDSSGAPTQASGDLGTASDDAVAGAGTLGKQLPPELIADLRLAGSDADGRLVTLAEGFVATAECSDCGAPSYLWFLAVRCADTRHCEVLTEQCEGKISREDDTFTLEFRPVEGGAAEVCAGYTGEFVLP